ncbi:PQ-loop repeat-containing protein [Bradyrhizobium japonicum]|uniref:Uncharacterized protein with PQ loop repeat n=1 Tax=Bradyrhizobium japonicum TaxID=375 RepID=A0ABV2RL95_BRAJP|nr:PQ-loop repeat-containing protein [Bradyrhizobium japonicum]MCP1762422.1 uncharacterized protein with PQ loop repeat [Bradyrhizobium japonicum]MCP1794002.1 uncharacterized protein with PQ loop repeat [Bradyrhizobium japonicum]MCP1806435.1 uncharacterized protein with PQ loop repeat [Bradyrhizobium japonicum]MCP1815363.1 uncharacterized protein with PQ loop repeat [Bradyrhizobium japonicum]MCP1873120.1 uncharacterized protein with PQ loop repeat [Bradyrhizobium japonicum]
MLDPFAPYVGGIAAFLAALSYVPQVRKAWPRSSTGDLSLFMLGALTLVRFGSSTAPSEAIE